ncbi:MAG: hypothetical protein M5U34_09415 [Chloroflexi bacterium]|nr:hypothetical protein [Chloroflexota bacterium]
MIWVGEMVELAKLKVPQGTDVFTKGGLGEEGFQHKRGDEVGHNHPCREPGRGPQVEPFVEPQIDKQNAKR